MAAIKTTREQFEQVINKADQHMTTTIRRFEQLTKEAQELERDIAFAKALRSTDPTPWLNVTADSWDAVFAKFLTWAEIHRINSEASQTK